MGELVFTFNEPQRKRILEAFSMGVEHCKADFVISELEFAADVYISARTLSVYSDEMKDVNKSIARIKIAGEAFIREVEESGFHPSQVAFFRTLDGSQNVVDLEYGASTLETLKRTISSLNDHQGLIHFQHNKQLDNRSKIERFNIIEKIIQMWHEAHEIPVDRRKPAWPPERSGLLINAILCATRPILGRGDQWCNPQKHGDEKARNQVAQELSKIRKQGFRSWHFAYPFLNSAKFDVSAVG